MDRQTFRLNSFNTPEGFEQLEKEAYGLERQRREAIFNQGKFISADLAARITVQALDDILDLHGLPIGRFRQQNAALILLSPRLW